MVGGSRLLTDIVSLVRFALRQADVLVPYNEQVDQRFSQWLAQQQTAGVVFTPEQHQWLALIRDHVAASMGIDIDDFDLVPFEQKGGAGKASLDVFWLRDDSLEDSDNLPPPDVLAAEIVEDLKAALEQFAEIQSDLVMTRDQRGG